MIAVTRAGGPWLIAREPLLGFKQRCLVATAGPRPTAQLNVGRTLDRRCATFDAGENKSGHISAGPNEGIFFFDSTSTVQLTRNLVLIPGNRHLPSKAAMA